MLITVDAIDAGRGVMLCRNRSGRVYHAPLDFACLPALVSGELVRVDRTALVPVLS